MWLKPDFLNGRFNSEEEYNNYLQTLLARADNNDPLTIDERNEFCHCLDKAERDKYKICEDTVFRDLYLDHFISRFEGRTPSFRDSNRLRKLADDWDNNVVQVVNHGDELLQYVAKEARTEIKDYKKSRNLQNRKVLPTQDKLKIREIVLHSRWVHILTNFIFKRRGTNHVPLLIDGKEVHIDQYGIVHILSRHFAQLQKQHLKDKSYFTNEIMTYSLVDTIEEILTELENSGLLAGKDIMKLSVEYKGKPYRIYLKEVVKQKAGVGNYNVLRVNTFYPIESQGELLEIGAMTKTKITDDLYLYV